MELAPRIFLELYSSQPDIWPDAGWMPAGFQPDAGWMLAGCRPDAGRMPASCQLDAGRMPAGCRPDVRPDVQPDAGRMSGPDIQMDSKTTETPRHQDTETPRHRDTDVSKSGWSPPTRKVHSAFEIVNPKLVAFGEKTLWRRGPEI